MRIVVAVVVWRSRERNRGVSLLFPRAGREILAERGRVIVRNQFNLRQIAAKSIKWTFACVVCLLTGALK